MQVWGYAKTVCRHWLALMSCAAFTFLGVYAAATDRTPEWIVHVSFLLALIFVVVAGYRTWRDEHVARIEAENELKSARIKAVKDLDAEKQRYTLLEAESEKDGVSLESEKARQQLRERNRKIIEYAELWSSLWRELVYSVPGGTQYTPNSPVRTVSIPRLPEELGLIIRLMRMQHPDRPIPQPPLKTVSYNPVISERIQFIGSYLSNEAKRFAVETPGIRTAIIEPIKAAKKDRNLAAIEVGRLKSKAELSTC